MNEKQIAIYSELDKFLSLDDYPKNAKIFIYSDNIFGRHLKLLLEIERPDVCVLGFVNSFAEGTVASVPRVLPDALKTQNYDFVVITLINFIDDIVERISFVEQSKLRINLVGNLSYYGHYEPNPTLNKDEKIRVVETALKDPKDRQLWTILINALRNRSMQNLVDWFIEYNNVDFHYLEYCNLKAGDTVLEGGVFDGNTSCRFAEIVGDAGHVYSFDPLGDEYASETLQKNAAIVHRINIFPYAISNTEGEVCFDIDGPGSCVADEGGMRVRSIALDDFVAEKNLQRVDFIKMDIEGAEPEALEGVWKSVEKFRPALAISIYHRCNQFIDIPFFLVDKLKNYTFNLSCYSYEGLETVFYCTPDERVTHH